MRDWPKVAEKPDGPWMRRLQETHWVWLCKEEEYASVLFPWQPPGPGHVSGRLVLNKMERRGDEIYRGETQVWYIRVDGSGFDGKQLILPCEGHLPETFAEIVDGEAAELKMTINSLLERVRRLEIHVGMLELGNELMTMNL